MALVSFDTFLIALRESLEAFLIISIFAGLVAKLGHPEFRRHLLWGAGAAVAFSVVIGIIIHASVLEFYETSGFGEFFEGAVSLIAVGILTYMVVWMYRHTLTLVEQLRQQAHSALEAGKPLVFAAIAFVAVAREGLETVLFVATQVPTVPATTIVVSLILGIGVSATLAFLTFTGIIRLNVRKFFATTGLLLIFFAGGLLATSVHEFSEVGLVPESAVAWNTEAVLDQHSTFGSMVKALFGYREAPTVLEVLAYFGYVIGLAAWYVQGIRRSSRPSAPTAAPAAEPN